MFSGLDRTALGLTVYASQGESPLHHARLVSGCWPSSAGRDSLTRRVAMKGFCVRVTSSFLELFLTQRHPLFGRLCVQAIRDAPVDPPAIQRLTMTVRRNSPNLQPANEMRVSWSPAGRGESLGVWNPSVSFPVRRTIDEREHSVLKFHGRRDALVWMLRWPGSVV